MARIANRVVAIDVTSSSRQIRLITSSISANPREDRAHPTISHPTNRSLSSEDIPARQFCGG